MAKKYQDIRVTKTYGPHDITTLDDLRNIIATFDELQNVYVDISDENGGGGDADIVIRVSGIRRETDEERDKRLADARDMKKKRAAIIAERENKEREALRELLAKYPDEAEPWTIGQ